MREASSLVKAFDLNEEEDLVVDESGKSIDAFKLPNRNWNLLIDSYNSSHKRKFPFSPLQCKVIIEFVKKGVPPKYIFQTLGVNAQRYGHMVNTATDLDEKLEILATKAELSEDEYALLNDYLRHPLRVLMNDISRAEGVANLGDWETFNEMSVKQPEVLMAKMRAKFKDVFTEKDMGAGSVNVQINLGGDWIQEL